MRDTSPATADAGNDERNRVVSRVAVPSVHDVVRLDEDSSQQFIGESSPWLVTTRQAGDSTLTTSHVG